MGTCKQLKSKLSERQMPWQKAETDPHSFLLLHRGPKSGLGLLRPNSGARWHSSSEGPKNQGAQRPGTSRPHFRPTSPGLQDRGAGACTSHRRSRPVSQRGTSRVGCGAGGKPTEAARPQWLSRDRFNHMENFY